MYKFLSICVFSLSCFTAALGQNFTDERNYDPVVISGDQLSSLQGKSVNSFFGYRFDASTQSWTQVPFQVDERRWTDISVGGTKHPGHEYWYVNNEGNGFDSDDEIAFMIEDLGDMAPENSWPSNTDEERYEIQITDPLNGAVGYLYIFTSSSLSYAGGDLISYSRSVTGQYSESTNVTSNYYSAHLSGNWILDEIHVQNNPDLIDRLKFRVYALNGSEFHETEDYWSEGRSDYMGAVDGPVRAIRMVQGAASGPTTTYFMKFYRKSLRVTYHYRVHGIPDLWYYMDYKSSITGDQYYGTSSPSRWGQVSSDRGSLVISTNPSALSSHAESEATYYRNDPGFNDGTGEDGQAIQNHGLYFHKIDGLDESVATPIYSNFYFLPANASNRGATFHNVSLTDVNIDANLQQKQTGPDTEPPVVNISSSIADEYIIGTNLDISWQASDNIGIAATKFEFIRNGFVEITENWTGDPGTYSITLEEPASSNCLVRITCTDAALNSDFAESAVFSIVEPPPDTEAPTIQLLTQFPAELFVDNDLEINWQANDNVGVTRILVELLRNGFPETLADMTSGSSHIWTVSAPTGTNNILRITAFDAANNSNSAQSSNFTISESSGIPQNTLRVIYHFAERTRSGWFWRGNDNVTVVDENDNPVSNATVSVTYNGPTSGSASAQTSTIGEADLVSRTTWNLRNLEWCFTIANVTKSGYTYRPEYNTAAVTACTGEQQPNQPPVAVATGSPNNQPAPATVTFSGSGSSDPDGSIVSYAWNFADGQQGSGVTANHTYNSPGTYTVVLTVTDNDGATATATVNITVTTPPNQDPVAQASATPISGVIPLAVQFTGSSSYDPDGDITYHEWDFGDGSEKVAATNPQHTYTSAGTFTAKLTVIDDDGASDIAELTITASEPPNQPPNAVAGATPQSGVMPLQVTFSSNGSSDTDGSIVSYSWNFGDGGQSTAQNPQHTYTNSGQFQAVLTVTDDDGATDTASITITVTDPANQAPNAAISADPQSGQAPLVVNFNGAGSSDDDGTIVSYSWNFGDGGQSTAQNPQHTYAAAGQFNVQLTVTDDDGATGSAQLTITVTESPNQAPNAVAS
ncbi:MAG: PKD domain-containing protein, partial [Deferribacteres bacterium]|nr:PKD domain-containing protein [Deferribacteres bacterium]